MILNLVFISLITCLAMKSSVGQQKPNIVIFLADDAGYLDNAVFGSGEVNTPTMQQLAKTGMRFNNAFVASPACAPSRSALLTGLMPARNGSEANHTHPPKSIPILTSSLQQNGYEVISFGKVADGKMAQNCGWDYNNPSQGLSKDVDNYFAGHKSIKPICLMVGDTRPHVPWTKQPTYNPEKVTLPSNFIDTKSTRQDRAEYYTDVTSMDAEMGKVLAIAEKQFGDNFIFIYSSDHGAQWPFGKWNLYDEGIRTPLLISWKGKVKAGSKSDAMVSWIDIFPTLLDITNSKSPENLNGKSFSKVLLGKSNEFRKQIYTTHSGDINMNVYPIRSVRDRRYHYILNLHPEYLFTSHSDLLKKPNAGDYWYSWYEQAKKDSDALAIVEKYHLRPAQELYDVVKDPLEQHNLATNTEYRSVLNSMDKDLHTWMKAQGDKETVFNTPIKKTPDFPFVK